MSLFRNQLLLLTSISSLFFMSACNDPTPKEKISDIVRPVKILEIKAEKEGDFRNFPAKVEANATSKLAFRVNGQINEFKVKAGNEVKKGEVLASLDPKDFQLQVDDRKARYQLAKSQFERAKLLLAKKLIPQSQYDQAKANLSVAAASLDAVETELAYTHLVAPFNGSIANVMVEKHETIQAKQPILTLISRDMIDISIQVPENTISRVKKDTQYQPTVIFDSHPNQEFLVTVKEWDTQADPSTLTYKVVFSLASPQAFNVLPGMSANLRIDLSKILKEQNHYYMLPINAIFSPENTPVENHQSYVWLVDPKTSKVSQKQVEIGKVTRDGVEITKGIKAGDRVVTAGVHYLSEGMQVRAWTREKGL